MQQRLSNTGWVLGGRRRRVNIVCSHVITCSTWTHDADDLFALCLVSSLCCRPVQKSPLSTPSSTPNDSETSSQTFLRNIQLWKQVETSIQRRATSLFYHWADIVCTHRSLFKCDLKWDGFHCSNIIYYFWCLYLFLRFKEYFFEILSDRKSGGYIEPNCCLSLFSVPHQWRSNIFVWFHNHEPNWKEEFQMLGAFISAVRWEDSQRWHWILPFESLFQWSTCCKWCWI